MLGHGDNMPIGRSVPPVHLRRFTGLDLLLARVLLDPHPTLGPCAARRTSPPAPINCQRRSCKTACGLFDLHAPPRIGQGKAKVLIYGFLSPKDILPSAGRKTAVGMVSLPADMVFTTLGRQRNVPGNKSHHKL